VFFHKFSIFGMGVLKLLLDLLKLFLSHHFLNGLFHLLLMVFNGLVVFLSQNIDLLRTVADLMAAFFDLPLQTDVLLLQLFVIFLKDSHLLLIF
jgi:hypothetical protein